MRGASTKNEWKMDVVKVKDENKKIVVIDQSTRIDKRRGESVNIYL